MFGVLKKLETGFVKQIKERSDTLIYEVRVDNRDELAIKIIEYIKNLKGV